MKGFLKKKSFMIVSLAVLAAVMFAALGAVAIATGGFTVDSGRGFSALENIAQDKYYQDFPATVEAWVKVPAGSTAAQGAIFSNYRGDVAMAEYGASFEIAENGKPRVLIDNGAHMYDIKFDANAATGEWTHIAFSFDASGGTVECFVNGASVGINSSLSGVAIADGLTYERPFMVGGSYERYNPQYFKGEINSVAVFADNRSADEILLDCSGGVSDNEDGLISKYDFSGESRDSYTDLSGNGYNLSEKIFLDSSEYTPITDFEYSIAIVGDTQRVTELYPDSLIDMYQWIADNADKEKIQLVLGMGDITEQSLVTQWDNAMKSHKILENAGIPYQLTRGNHDMKTTNPNDSTRMGMNDVFGVYAPYMSQFEGCFEEGDSTNTYRTQRIGDIDYLFLALDYGASDDMLAWADEVVSSHPNHKVIISTHGYEYYTGKKLGFAPNKGTIPAASNDYEFKKYSDNPNVRDYNSAVDMWNEFASKHGNIMLILSGHESADDIVYHTEEGIHGNDVMSFLINPQGADDRFGGVGTVCLFKFSADGRKIYVEYYSVIKEAYFNSVNQFTLTLSDDSYDYHTVEQYKLTSDATCEANAAKTGVCTGCGFVHTEEIVGSMHSHAVSSYIEKTAAGCESNAIESGICVLCQTEVTRERPNTASGHSYKDGECTVCHKNEENPA